MEIYSTDTPNKEIITEVLEQIFLYASEVALQLAAVGYRYASAEFTQDGREESVTMDVTIGKEGGMTIHIGAPSLPQHMN